MKTPDFARLGPPALEPRDLLFLFEHFPVPGVDAIEAARRVHERWNTLDSLLESDYVYDAIHDQSVTWLEVSPKLFFNVLLRRALPGRRDPLDRQTIHYLANLLALFARTERLFRVQDDEQKTHAYLVDLVQEAEQADSERCFVVQSHIGNYALFTAGVLARAVDYRHRYKRRPVTIEYYCRVGRSYFFTASKHRLAEEYGLRDVFGRLAERFDYYRAGLERMSARVLM